MAHDKCPDCKCSIILTPSPNELKCFLCSCTWTADAGTHDAHDAHDAPPQTN